MKTRGKRTMQTKEIESVQIKEDKVLQEVHNASRNSLSKRGGAGNPPHKDGGEKKPRLRRKRSSWACWSGSAGLSGTAMERARCP